MNKGKGILRKYWSIQTKIYVSAAIVLTSLSLILTLLSVYYIRNSTKNALELSMQETAQISADRTKDFLQDKVTLAKSLSASIGSTYAEEITRPYQEVNLGALDKAMEDLCKRYDFDYMYIVDNKGYTRNLRHIDISRANLNHYKQIVVQGKDSFISDVSLDSTLDAQVINFTVPIKDVNKKIIGVLVCQVKADKLSTVMSDTKVGKKGRTFIMDNQGICIAHQDPKMRYNGETYIKVRHNTDFASLNAMLDTVHEKTKGYLEYEYNGKRLCAFQTIAGTTNWTLAVTADENEFMGATRQAIIVSGILALILLFLCGAVVYLVIHPITVNITGITNRLERLADGDLREDVEISKGNDEITRLTFAVSNLLKELHTIIDSINIALRSMAGGNLDVKLKGHYPGDFMELKTSTEQSIAKLSDLVNHIAQTSAEVSRGSAQIADGSTSLAQGASEQASSVEQLHNTVRELSKHAQEIANMDNDYLDDEITVKSKEENEKRIDDAPTLADKLIVAMSCIEERLTEVRKISAVIENVSSQSGMLALNAAVEATHAGEYGRGFSVIASEIRELSEKCKQEAKTTDELIDYILLSVERGNKVVGFTVDSVRNISSSLSDVENTLSQISSVIEGTAATAEEFAASSEELSAQAEVLKELSAGFTVQQPDDILTEQSTTNKMGEKLL